MTQLYLYPDNDAKQHIRDTIAAFAQGKMRRTEMMAIVARTMTFYRVTKLNCGDFLVVLANYDGMTAVIVSSNRRSDGEHCPVCNSPIANSRYLYTDSEGKPGTVDEVSWNCLDCGSFYKAVSPNDEERRTMWDEGD